MSTMNIRRLFIAAVVGSGLVAAVGMAEPTTKPAFEQKLCIVSDEELGSMGDPVVLEHEGRQVKFCCKACIKKFKSDPAKYIKKLDEQAAAATTQPSN